jgi:hypothetical protein
MLTAIRPVFNVIAALAITLVPAIAAAAEPTPDPAEPYVVGRIVVGSAGDLASAAPALHR